VCTVSRFRAWTIRLAALPSGVLTAVFATAVRAADGAPAPPPTRLGLLSLPRDLSPWGMFLSADIVVKLVMVGLAFASVVTWTILLAKGIEILAARRAAQRALAALDDARSLVEAGERCGFARGPVAEQVRAAVAEARLSTQLPGDGLTGRVASRLERIEVAAARRILRGTGVLATIGSTAPFVGLFGTVWGIMNSFIGISRAQTTNLAVVAPGIAEALLATAMGLVAAIPAVVIYNLFARWSAGYRLLLGDGSAALVRMASRDLERQALPPAHAAE